MRPFRGPFAVVYVDQLLTHALVEGCGTDVRVGELVCLGTGAEPHFGNVEI